MSDTISYEEFEDYNEEVHLDNELDTSIRPLIEPIFLEILFCYDQKEDKDLRPFFNCVKSKVIGLVRDSINYIKHHLSQREIETNKLHIKDMIKTRIEMCINNGNELNLDTRKWMAMLQCIMGRCEQHIDLAVNMMMAQYAIFNAVNQVKDSKFSGKQKSTSKVKSPNRRSPIKTVHMNRRSPSKKKTISPRKLKNSPKKRTSSRK